MPPTPEVSLCIPSYNCGRWLAAAIDSALAQAGAELEVVVAEDGSTDDSLEIARSFAQRDARVRVVTHPEHRNHGTGATHNLALRGARSQLLGWLGSDDRLLPGALAAQLARLQDRPELGFVYGRARLIDERGEATGASRGGDVTACRDPLARLLRGNPIPACTVLLRRECLERVGEFDETLIYCDWELWLRVVAHWRCGYLARPLAEYRVHGGNLSLGVPRDVHARRSIEALERLREKSPQLGGRLATPWARALMALELARHRFALDERAAASSSLRRALHEDPELAAGARLAAWLRTTGRTEAAQDDDRDESLGGWMVAALSDGLDGMALGRLRRAADAAPAVAAAWRAHKRGDRREARRRILESLRKDPIGLSDRGLRGVLLRSTVLPRG